MSKAKVTQHKPGPKLREHIDSAIRAAKGACAVEGMLGCRYSKSKVGGSPYERYLLSDGRTLFVSGFHKGKDGIKVTVSERPASKGSYTVKLFLDRKARQEKARRR